MTPDGLNDQVAIIRAAATFHRLLLLDDIWTAYLGQAKAIPKRDVATLDRLTAEMRSLLSDAKAAVPRLKKFISRVEIDWDGQFSSLVNASNHPSELKEKVLATVSAEGGVKRRTFAALDAIARGAAEDQRSLRRKMAIIKKGRFAPGDLSLACIIDAAGIGVGLAAGGLGGGLLAGYSLARAIHVNHCFV